jgi:hypothetical protein
MAFEKAFARLTLLSLLVALGSSLQAGCSTGTSFDPRVCALVTGCMGTLGEGVSPWCETLQSVEANPGTPLRRDNFSHETLQCVSGATTCGEVTACLTATPSETAACNGKSTYQCSGDVLVKCGVGTPLIYDCAQDGQHCFQGTASATCGTGTCDPSTTPSSCQGDVVVRCANIGTATEPSGVLVPTECSKQWGWALDVSMADACNGPGVCTSLFANTCGVEGGVAQCMGSGAACDPNTFVASCSGTVVSACTGGKVAHFDCASLGPLTCQGSSFPNCFGAGTECADFGGETCQDGVITYCLWGTKQTMDCKSYGFSGCTTTMWGGSKPGAQCTR